MLTDRRQGQVGVGGEERETDTKGLFPEDLYVTFYQFSREILTAIMGIALVQS